jgi:hypothetical protein
VVDTHGLSTKNSFLDWYRTPHSEKEHVIERFKLARDGNSLEALVTVGRDRDTVRAALGQGLAVSAFPRYVPV